jgi:hypothetical protein
LEARQRELVLLDVTGRLTLASHALELRDRALALQPRWIAGGQPFDQAGDAVSELEREVRRGRADQLADVLDGDPVIGREAIGPLCAAQNNLPFAPAVHGTVPPVLNSGLRA